MVASREIHLKSRPHGVPRKDNFSLVTVEVPEPGPGEFLVRNIWMSLFIRQPVRVDAIWALTTINSVKV